MDHNITECIRQLAERAEELGETNTAIVLYTLSGQLILNCDFVLATAAKEQSTKLLKKLD